MKIITVETLFGAETITVPRRSIKFKQIRATMETLEVREEVAAYLQADRRYTSPEQVAQIFSFLHNEAKEHFFTVHLDGKNRILCLDLVSVGSLNQSIVHPREVFKTSLSTSAAALLLVHNHPTGDPTPSAEDIAITRRLKEAGEIIGIKVLDHVIVGTEGYLSFVERGLL
ncbi:MAG TPA: DNA repair protein RadC [Desulfuromonadales bacterium]|jgi:DNA repair protein RadC|nr:DNA repair protein RadC [Desulfuromonadales bacterium]